MSLQKNLNRTFAQYLEGGGEMGRLTRAFNWAKTAVGSPDTWSQSLLTTLSILLNSKFPMFLWWGPELIQFYNDAYRPSLGNDGKHPDALGQRGEDCWPEIWPIINPLIRQVLLEGESVWQRDQCIPIYRNGRLEDVYWTFSYSRVNDETGRPAGVLVVCSETTEQILNRQKIEKVLAELRASEEHLRLATSAAELGTFDMDLLNGTLKWDERCRELFGISHKGRVTYEQDFLLGLHEDDRERIGHLIKNLFIKSTNNGDYDVEYRTVGAIDKKLRWVRAKGKVLFNDKDQPVRFIGSVLDITDKKMDEQRKNDFIGMVSHELKTPLTSVKAYVQMLGVVAGEQNNSFFSESLERVEKQVNKMNAMINGFLNVSRLESGKIHLHKRIFNLNDIVSETIGEIRLASSNDNISFVPCAPVLILADAEKIGHVISNFLSNALKYSPAGSMVDVKCGISHGYAQLSVKDQGIGIDPQDIDRLFERFYRVSSQETERISGFGIGLYLSAEIIKRHNGKIWVESEKGKGSTFYFTLPIVEMH